MHCDLQNTFEAPNGFHVEKSTEIPTIIDFSATRKYPSATGSIIIIIIIINNNNNCGNLGVRSAL